jgi:hypothetical protein
MPLLTWEISWRVQETRLSIFSKAHVRLCEDGLGMRERRDDFEITVILHVTPNGEHQ